jgi:hypothetical protein
MQRAERAGFASLGTLDRLVYSNSTADRFAAAAAVTERIELVTDILIAPPVEHSAVRYRPPRSTRRADASPWAWLPGTPDDFEASGVDFTRRGRIFDQQLDEMTAVARGARHRARAQAGRAARADGGRTDAAYQRAATTPTAGRSEAALPPWSRKPWAS